MGSRRRQGAEDETCVVCGGVPTRPLQVVRDAQVYVFDAFECAIHALAPRCPHCSCTIIGHGHQTEGELFCCAHCADAFAAAEPS
jgi:hypothetical protein